MARGPPTAERTTGTLGGRWISLRPELLLRSVTTTLTGEAMFSALDGVQTSAFRNGLQTTVRHIDSLLNLIGSRLGLDHNRVLGGKYALPLMSRYLAQRGGSVSNPAERDRLLYWYVHSFLWGRYAGSTESILNQDLGTIENIEGAVDRLIENLRRDRGDLRLHPADFLGSTRGARFYPLLYMLTRVWRALDWETGVELKGHLLGSLSSLETAPYIPEGATLQGGVRSRPSQCARQFHVLDQGNEPQGVCQGPSVVSRCLRRKGPGTALLPLDTLGAPNCGG